MTTATSTRRCSWANPSNPRYLAYHDHEWGVPCHDETTLFEMLNLEGAQAGLSWETILNKRDSYRAAFDGWDSARIARYDDAKVAALLADPGIVRNRLKVNAAIGNARAYLRMCEEGLTLDRYLWDVVGGRPIVNDWPDDARPARTELSDRLSKDLSKRGFKFVGSTIVYAYMQGIGLVDDHDRACICRQRRA
jgi:DNA-3-methyladenine glycosylase I